MKNLVIDIGNTTAKIGVFLHGKLKSHQDNINLQQLPAIAKAASPSNIMISSVAANPQQLKEKLQQIAPTQILTHQTKIPITNTYHTPQTLGLDRLAAVVAANAQCPGKDCLVIDMGTSITYDLIDHKANYHGGRIAPGLQMRFNALHTFTKRLPQIQWNQQKNPQQQKQTTMPPGTGKNTPESIKAGVIWGILHEIQGTISYYQDNYPRIQVITCGGDAPIFESNINHHIFAVPHLVLFGIDRILAHNAEVKQ